MIYNRLENIFSSLFGDSKRGVNEHSGQIQFNCPECSSNSYHLYGDGKYNLELNFKKGVYKCWACSETNNMSGRLSSLIKKYGSTENLKEYYDEIRNIKDLIIFSNFQDGEVTDKCYDCELYIPKSAKIIKKDDYKAKKVIEYLTERGIGWDIINRYKLYYTTFDVPKEEKNLINRVIIPSYDRWGTLNYWVGRKYDKFPTPYKYINPDDTNKTDFIINEHLLNWDGDIRLVEGPFDHIVVPNSTPLLGKVLDENSYLFECIVNKLKGTLTIFIDAEALKDTKIIFKKLYQTKVRDKIRYVTYKNFTPLLNKYNIENTNKQLTINDLDPSLINQLFGRKGVVLALKDVDVFDEFDLI